MDERCARKDDGRGSGAARGALGVCGSWPASFLPHPSSVSGRSRHRERIGRTGRFGVEPGEAVLKLLWLAPGAASLAALARGGASAWSEIRTDPGAVLLLLRFGPPFLAVWSILPLPRVPSSRDCSPSPAPLKQRPDCLMQAQPDSSTGACRRSSPSTAPLSVCSPGPSPCRTIRLLRSGTGVGVRSAGSAWLAGPLRRGPGRRGRVPGRSGLEARSGAVSAPPLGLRSRRPGPAAPGRWGLPAWLTAIAGHLSLPAELAQVLGADPDTVRPDAEGRCSRG